MADFYNSGVTYNQLAALASPKWSLNNVLKRSYKDTVAWASKKTPQINAMLGRYKVRPVDNSAQYKKLVEHYNNAYQSRAQLAAAQALESAAAADAGFGNSYAAPTAGAAYNAAMANRAAATPALLAAASKAAAADMDSRYAAITALQRQRDVSNAAAREMYNMQLEARGDNAVSKRAGHAARRTALEKLNKELLAFEKAKAKEEAKAAAKKK